MSEIKMTVLFYTGNNCPAAKHIEHIVIIVVNKHFFHSIFTGSIHGTAKLANIISVKVLNESGHSKVSCLIEGLEWISTHINRRSHFNAHPTSVINLSLSFDKDSDGDFDLLDDVIRAIPAVSVAAAGNQDIDACNRVPARFSSVITVGATQRYDRLTYYTNYGPCVDILAPGHSIVSASHRNDTGEVKKSGTSMSTGFVSGNCIAFST